MHRRADGEGGGISGVGGKSVVRWGVGAMVGGGVNSGGVFNL